ncbi:MAG: pilus assembly protein TadG-related protein [Actinomycetota bacterium]
MRVRRPRWRWLTRRMRDLHDERGAVAVIVVLSLAGLLGMLVLTVDLGGMLTMRRRMVAAADSAALAAAQSCARQLPAEAQSQADSLAGDNETGARPVSYTSSGCNSLDSSGTVHVAYTAPIELEFAPVLGLPDRSNVRAAATAEWGPAGGIGPLPIVVSLDEQGRVPCVWEDKGTACNYWYDNGVSGFSDRSNWGFINLDEWGDGANDSCPSAGTSTRRDWIGGVGVPQVSINETGPTYVCADSGHSTPTWYSSLQALVGKIRYFPVNDPSSMILHPPGREKYAILGFTALRIQAVLQGDDPEAIGVPGTTSACSTSVSFTSGKTVILDGLGGSGCPGGTHADTISGLALTSGNGSKKVTYRDGVDYTFNTVTHVITWTTAAVDVTISFSWSTAGSYGACGIRKKDPNAVCLVASWQGAQVGGTRPGGGEDFGVRAIRLSD